MPTFRSPTNAPPASPAACVLLPSLGGVGQYSNDVTMHTHAHPIIRLPLYHVRPQLQTMMLRNYDHKSGNHGIALLMFDQYTHAQMMSEPVPHHPTDPHLLEVEK